MIIHRVRAILLLCTNLLSVYKVSIGCWMVLLEGHHRSTLRRGSTGRANTSDHIDAVVIIVHVEYFLLLSIQISLSSSRSPDILLTVYVGEPHSTRHKNVVVLTATRLLHTSLTAVLNVG